MHWLLLTLEFLIQIIENVSAFPYCFKFGLQASYNKLLQKRLLSPKTLHEILAACLAH